MKTFLRVLVVSLFLTTLGVITGFAQDETSCPDLETCFKKYRELRKADCGKQDEAVRYGKYIYEKWKDDELNKELVAKIKADADDIEKKNTICKRNIAYNECYKAKNWDCFYNVAKEIINAPTTDKPLALDITLDLVSVGLNNAVAKNDKFNNETIMFAKSAIQMLESGIISNNWGVFEPFKSKENALSWSNYTIGYIMYYRQGETMAQKKDEAIPYFYKATLVGEKKNDTTLYIRIGQWYGDKATALYEEFTKIRDSVTPTSTEEEKTKITDAAKAKLALARGYAERAMDAFARAHKLASAEKPPKAELVKGLSDEITKFYKFRFNGKAEGQTEFVSALISKPMPDPSTAVMPVAEETPTTTTTSTTTTTEVKPATTTTEVKPATTTTTTVKTASTNGTTSKTAKVSTTTKTAAKKPVAKKKANR